MANWVEGYVESGRVPLWQHAGKEATLFEDLWWKSWTNVRVSSAIIYDPLQLCKYQCWATFLTANDGLSFRIIMTDQRWIIHPRALKYAITLQLLRIHLSLRSAISPRKGSAVINAVTTVSDRKLWTLALDPCCLFSLSKREIWFTTGKQHGGEISQLQNSPTGKSQFWPPTPTMRIRGVNEHSPKTQSIRPETKKNPSQRKSHVQVS